MKETIWIVKAGNVYNVFEDKAQAEEFFGNMNVECEIAKYTAVIGPEVAWEDMYKDEEEKYEKLSVELDGLRTAFADAKAESEKRINVAMDELKVARSDVHTLEEVIVKMAMRLVGM